MKDCNCPLCLAAKAFVNNIDSGAFSYPLKDSDAKELYGKLWDALTYEEKVMVARRGFEELDGNMKAIVIAAFAHESATKGHDCKAIELNMTSEQVDGFRKNCMNN